MLGEPGAHLGDARLEEARERDRLAGDAQTKHDARVIRSREHLGAEPARLGGRARAAVERDREPALGVRERDVDGLARAAGLDQRARRLLAARTRRARRRSARRPRPGSPRRRSASPARCTNGSRSCASTLAVDAERLLPGPDRRGVVLARPALHERLTCPCSIKLRDVATRRAADRGARRGARGVTRASSASTSSPSARSGRCATCPWGELPPIPEGKGTPQRQARRSDMWRSVLTQQLQADMLAVRHGLAAPEHRARPRGEALLLDDGAGRVAPHRGVAEADRRGRRHRRARPAPRQARAHDPRGRHARGEGLPDAGLLRAPDHRALPADRPRVARARCSRTSATGSTTDDGIHHGAGMAYERVLLEQRRQEDEAPARRRGEPAAADLRRARALAAEGARVHRQRDARRATSSGCSEDLEIGVRLAESLGLDVSDVELPASRLAATLMDGKALAERIRARGRATTSRELGARRARDGARRRRPGLARLRRARSTRPRARPASSSIDRAARRTRPQEELLALSTELNADDARRRHPRPAPAARRRSTRTRVHPRDRPDQGRRRLPPVQRRPALPRAARRFVPATPPGSWRCSTSTASRSRARARSSSGAAQIVGKPIAHLLLGAERDRDDLPLAHARPRRASRARRTCSSSASAAPRLVTRGHGQAGRGRRRRRHQPHRRRARRRRRTRRAPRSPGS